MQVPGRSDDRERLVGQLFGALVVAELLLDSSQVAQSLCEPGLVAGPAVQCEGFLEGLMGRAGVPR